MRWALGRFARLRGDDGSVAGVDGLSVEPAMERSATGNCHADTTAPDFAPLHPGYAAFGSITDTPEYWCRPNGPDTRT